MNRLTLNVLRTVNRFFNKLTCKKNDLTFTIYIHFFKNRYSGGNNSGPPATSNARGGVIHNNYGAHRGGGGGGGYQGARPPPPRVCHRFQSVFETRV